MNSAHSHEGEVRECVVAGQPAWVIQTPQVKLAITRLGGHMAPVSFFRDTPQPVEPYYVSPWQTESLSVTEPVLVPLRGDFFCMPFGGNQPPFAGEAHAAHGEPAGRNWEFDRFTSDGEETQLILKMQTTVRPGKVTKKICLRHGQNAIYTQHLLEGYAGAMPLGHHPNLRLPEAEGALHVTTSPMQFGQTVPGKFGDPAKGEYQSLADGERFQDLRSVPLAWRQPATADCTVFPARTGFTDLLAVFSVPRAQLGGNPAWVAAVNTVEGHLWYTLRDPDLLPATVFWICNRGRHGAPWNGRNRCLGLESVCAYFAEGLAASVQPNPLQAAGIPTAVQLDPERPTCVNFIQGLVPIPAGFDRVATVEFSDGQAVFVAPDGQRVSAAVDHAFV